MYHLACFSQNPGPAFKTQSYTCYNNIFIYSKKGRHICDGSSQFHVYSKKGWVSFCPDKDVLIVTIGDQTQVLQKLLKKSRIITLGFLFSTTSICLS
jgi:hypothetical protein